MVTKLWSVLLVLSSLFTAALLSATSGRHGDAPFNDRFLNQVLERAKTWTPDTSFEAGIRFSTFRNLDGIYQSQLDFTLPTKRHHTIEEVHIPKQFDAREKWPYCRSIAVIRNQGTCGSCWAVAAVSVMSDRLCIHSQGRLDVDLAAEDLMACCKDCGNGCNGGFLDGSSFQYWVDVGLVSGAPFNSTEGCKPYPFKPCEYPFKNCHKEETPRCSHHCVHGFDGRYRTNKFFGRVAYKIPNDERMIQVEIMTNGPVEAGFTVYEDLFLYRSGVYKHVVGKQVGKHAIRIIGWGKEQGLPYWLIANSYGPAWGEKGYLKMLRGSNHLGIENTVIAGLPKV
ncbi:cathepsin B-like [Topomyia yanbarensis]|uniref:cathepsin B-like n=1 Tax=Topomyia yanbarensis TaxID=2498891 RepID=UPI00273C7233|nr:cathepsin B-like [Topomyia yanbarensis]XP_058839885.1 cathepsin B-like [Topomyia yanbarensis]